MAKFFKNEVIIMKKIKILFQGDSITDADRDRADAHDLGQGYPKYAAELLKEKYPDVDFEFFNLGVSGDRTCQLLDRLYPDCVAYQPDIVSILIGVNDVWYRHTHKDETTDANLDANYRAILECIKQQSNAKILILAPFLLDNEDKEPWKVELATALPIIRSLADEYADAFVPLDKLFEDALKVQPSPAYYSGDGVHPNPNGAAFIAKHYVEAVSPMIDEIIAK